MAPEDPWQLILDVGANEAQDSGRIVAALAADGDEALLSFWTWLCARTVEYAQAHGVCMTDGLFSEAVELVLGGRSAFESAVATPDALSSVLGEEGFHFVEELHEAFEILTGEALPEPGAAPEAGGYDATWDLRMGQSLDGLPAAVHRAHDAAFGALAQSDEYRDAYRAAGITHVEIYGSLSHSVRGEDREAAVIDAVRVKRRADRVAGDFVWPTAELLLDDFDATVNRVRALLDHIASVVPQVPRADQIRVLDHIVDPDPDAGGWVQTSDWNVPLRGTVDLAVLDRALRDATRPPWRDAVAVSWVMVRDVVRWDSFLEACELEGRAADDVLSELVATLRETAGRSRREAEDDAVAAAVLETWPARVAAGKASER